MQQDNPLKFAMLERVFAGIRGGLQQDNPLKFAMLERVFAGIRGGLQQDNPLKYATAGAVTIIYLSFIVAVLKIQNPVAQTFAAFGINMALLFVILNIGALAYGIVTRNRGDAD